MQIVIQPPFDLEVWKSPTTFQLAGLGRFSRVKVVEFTQAFIQELQSTLVNPTARMRSPVCFHFGKHPVRLLREVEVAKQAREIVEAALAKEGGKLSRPCWLCV